MFRPDLCMSQPPIQQVQGSLLGIKWQEHEVDHSPSPSAELKNEWSYTPTSPVGLHSVDRHTFKF